MNNWECDWIQYVCHHKKDIPEFRVWSYHHSLIIKRQAERLHPPDYFLFDSKFWETKE